MAAPRALPRIAERVRRPARRWRSPDNIGDLSHLHACDIRSGGDAHGVSVFLREGDRVFHTYSAYGRGVDTLLGTYNYLDLTLLGRQRHVSEFPYHDTYNAGS
jgi:predicted dithiol-disulfide oxidoreductase (DUF899 family)